MATVGLSAPPYSITWL